jgi:energy-coupling factor transporter ATP-binding protein EcfA2
MINKLVNKYLAEFDFFLSFTLDSNFDETFLSRHRDKLQYYSFSEGQKLRIDLALLFTWRDIARTKNSCSTNLLIMDEIIDKSLDQNGTDLFIQLLNELGEHSNVFVISHKNEAVLDKFEDVIRFENYKNFNRICETV